MRDLNYKQTLIISSILLAVFSSILYLQLDAFIVGVNIENHYSEGHEAVHLIFMICGFLGILCTIISIFNFVKETFSRYVNNSDRVFVYGSLIGANFSLVIALFMSPNTTEQAWGFLIWSLFSYLAATILTYKESAREYVENIFFPKETPEQY